MAVTEKPTKVVKARMSETDIEKIEELRTLLRADTGASAIGTAVEVTLPLVQEMQRGGEVIVRQKGGRTKKLLLNVG